MLRPIARKNITSHAGIANKIFLDPEAKRLLPHSPETPEWWAFALNSFNAENE